ncbi:hypothetical protein [Nonomuraea jabiensis]|uniref:hypothetical protein n=1 Tax=Nonomuraea jabiensis TaxID=882448 RepID=UPI003D751A94
MSPDLAQVVARICARVAPDALAPVQVLSGYARVGLATSSDRRQRWVTGYRVQRELMLVGWRVRARPDHLLVGRWCSVNLAHRVQTLTAAVQAMQEVTFTVEAVLAALARHHSAHRDATTTEAITAAGAEVAAWYQRWPTRLTELEGLDREVNKPLTQQLLTRSQELERQILPLCTLHSRVVTHTTAALGDLLPRSGRSSETRTHLLQTIGEHFAGSLPIPSNPAALGDG